MNTRIVLAYSGSLATTVAIRWLQDRHHAEVVTVTLDLGQEGSVDVIRERALAAGATRAHVLDVRDEFSRDVLLRALRADALDDGRYPQIAALAWPMIGRALIDIARMEGADIVAHGAATPALDAIATDLRADIRVIAPVREWTLTGGDIVGYARLHGLPTPATPHARTHAHLWGRMIECGRLDEPTDGRQPVYALTQSPEDAPPWSASVDIGFENGVPVSVSGITMTAAEAIESLTTIAGPHGIGRLERTRVAADGSRSRQVYEAPAAIVLHTARAALDAALAPEDHVVARRERSVKYADLIASGRWFTSTREALDACDIRPAEQASGSVRVKMFKGDLSVIEVKSLAAFAQADSAAHRDLQLVNQT